MRGYFSRFASLNIEKSFESYTEAKLFASSAEQMKNALCKGTSHFHLLALADNFRTAMVGVYPH
ncbi:MAG: hypothetical protein A2664_02970 [Candidatus Taylorbacteria bacterium RIFCSPHIGHO2_01_FULL_46_22b]|uniref:Uncharacterized protein n=1 Tax=Candidatus Taylorbacteria bacterium RIFCSPHIGHO2_01_FULL_46_22b TaxID=1802301 RepID=A0A1G2M3V0_9BACT|nr:MAG: hypothetical protein A2664_02970 [Candidatus Taylorbacteria bacterium RIFCSPHIGHO2_01_FULL_46_22b]